MRQRGQPRPLVAVHSRGGQRLRRAVRMFQRGQPRVAGRSRSAGRQRVRPADMRSDESPAAARVGAIGPVSVRRRIFEVVVPGVPIGVYRIRL